ncbi:hypothetical protein N9A45_00170 [bacterium]|nr:hypothetical protein [bacterium]
MTTFWDEVPVKTDAQSALESRVFGCDDLWRHIKRFIFNETTCWWDDRCGGEIVLTCIHVHNFEHFRQGSMKRGRFKTLVHTCKDHLTVGCIQRRSGIRLSSQTR